jgi:hypothetical protein
MVFCSFSFVPYTNPHFWTNLNQTLHTSPPSSGRDRRVCMVQKCLTFSTLFDLRMERVQNPGHNMVAGARPFRHSVICVILKGVSVTSRCSRRHLLRVIRDSFKSVILAGVSLHGNDVVADDTCPELSATALYLWFLQVLVWRHGSDVVAGDICAFLLEVSCTMGNA